MFVDLSTMGVLKARMGVPTCYIFISGGGLVEGRGGVEICAHNPWGSIRFYSVVKYHKVAPGTRWVSTSNH